MFGKVVFRLCGSNNPLEMETKRDYSFLSSVMDQAHYSLLPLNQKDKTDKLCLWLVHLQIFLVMGGSLRLGLELHWWERDSRKANQRQ